MKFKFEGLMAPVFTPFNEKHELNLSVIPSYVRYLTKKGINGILVNGTSGEGMSLNVAERKTTAETWINNATPNQHVMVQVGGAPLPDVLELAKHAEINGAHSILCLPDLYMKPKNSQELIRYMKLVSDAAPKTPLLYYHIPMFTGVNIPMGDFLEKISNDEVPTFVGIKFTSNDLAEGMQAVKANRGKYSVFLGSDTIMIGAYALGFTSCIATTLNMFPEQGTSIHQAFLEKNNQNAQKYQDKLSNIVHTITGYGPWVPSMKATMNMITDINCGPVRPPMHELSIEDNRKLKADLIKMLNLT